MSPSRNWLIGPRPDLIWIVLSAGVGWLYLILILAVGTGLDAPLTDPFVTLRLGETAVPLTLGLVVFASWAVLLDAPHLFATLARTVADPEEWRIRGGVLAASFGFFLLGPALLLVPRLALPPEHAPIGGLAFLIFFRLWAYYHVVRQHWGFLRLYARRNPDAEDRTEARVDRLVFPLLFYLPVGWYLTAPWFADTGMPDLGLAAPAAHRAIFAAWLATAFGYAGFQWFRHRSGKPANLPKLLLLAATVPLHAAAFSSPLLTLFVVPLVTAGHNLQYHRFVWDYGKKRYPTGNSLAAVSFRNPMLYLALGLGFTFLCYRGPLVDWFSGLAASFLDQVALPLAGFMAGAPQGGGTLGGQVVAAAILGWAMQHYWLDARIWRVSKDEQLRRVLKTPSTR